MEVVNGLVLSPSAAATPKLATLGIKAFRQTAFKPYRVIYRGRSTVLVYLIADGRRDMQSLAGGGGCWGSRQSPALTQAPNERAPPSRMAPCDDRRRASGLEAQARAAASTLLRCSPTCRLHCVKAPSLTVAV